jgi:hypothetical protein
MRNSTSRQPQRSIALHRRRQHSSQGAARHLATGGAGGAAREASWQLGQRVPLVSVLVFMFFVLRTPGLFGCCVRSAS